MKCVDQVHHISLQKAVDDPKGILIRSYIEIQRSPEKVFRRICQVELLGGSCIPANFEENAADPARGSYNRIIDGAGLIGVFEGHFISVLPQFVKGVRRLRTALTDGPLVRWRTNLFIADIDTGIKPGEIDIDPPGIFRPGFKKAGILYNRCIYRIFESIRIAFLIKELVLVGGKVYFKVASSLGSIDTIAGVEKSGDKQ